MGDDAFLCCTTGIILQGVIQNASVMPPVVQTIDPIYTSLVRPRSGLLQISVSSNHPAKTRRLVTRFHAVVNNNRVSLTQQQYCLLYTSPSPRD